MHLQDLEEYRFGIVNIFSKKCFDGQLGKNRFRKKGFTNISQVCLVFSLIHYSTLYWRTHS
mgnify:CR=1 FL=1